MVMVRTWIAVVLLLGPAGFAQAADDTTVNRTHDFLRTDRRGRDLLGFLHFGSRYEGHKYVKTLAVNDSRGTRVPGHFALVYQFTWDRTGDTEVAFLCDDKGYVYDIQVTRTNAVFSPPYELANATVKVLGKLLLEAFKDKLSDADKRDLNKIIDAADARAMMLWSVKVQQRLGR